MIYVLVALTTALYAWASVLSYPMINRGRAWLLLFIYCAGSVLDTGFALVTALLDTNIVDSSTLIQRIRWVSFPFMLGVVMIELVRCARRDELGEDS